MSYVFPRLFMTEITLAMKSMLKLEGCELIRSDHPSDTKRGGVCIFYKNHLPLVKKDDISQLSECLVCEINKKSSKSFITCLYRSPSQSKDKITEFCSNLEETLCSIVQSLLL